MDLPGQTSGKTAGRHRAVAGVLDMDMCLGTGKIRMAYWASCMGSYSNWAPFAERLRTCSGRTCEPAAAAVAAYGALPAVGSGKKKRRRLGIGSGRD